jgi:hypothetical protein
MVELEQSAEPFPLAVPKSIGAVSEDIMEELGQASRRPCFQQEDHRIFQAREPVPDVALRVLDV